MLILTGRPGEKFYIDEDLIVQILGVKGNQVKVGFIVPDHIDVDREKIHLLKIQQRMEAKAKNDPHILRTA